MTPADRLREALCATVVNLRHERADIVIDRRSRWGNPYRIGDDAGWGRLDREAALRGYRDYLALVLERDPDFLEPLRGKRLGCWCKPLACHGDIIVEMLNG